MACAKRRYRDLVSAKLALANIVQRDNPKRFKTEQRAYKCSECKGWHLTSLK